MKQSCLQCQYDYTSVFYIKMFDQHPEATECTYLYLFDYSRIVVNLLMRVAINVRVKSAKVLRSIMARPNAR